MNEGKRRQLFCGDCLTIMREHIADSSIDLIYLDPPFNSNSTYNLPFRPKDKSVRPAAAFIDRWSWTDDNAKVLRAWSNAPERRTLTQIIEVAKTQDGKITNTSPSLAAYLVNMAERLLEMKRVIRPTGSIYLHCDPTASHYLKLLMDAIFGKVNFRNEIVWCYTGPTNSKSWFARKHQTIFFYAASKAVKFYPDAVRIPYKNLNIQHQEVGGSGIGGSLTPDNLTKYTERGKIPEDHWHESYDKMSPVGRKKNEYLGYPTQKPLALLKRIILASSKKGDIVLDPFCGCGTAAEAAEILGRRWAGIDISPFSVGLVRNRLIAGKNTADKANIDVSEIPYDVNSARALAKQNRFTFEKWICGEIGASGMFHPAGRRGADGGIDGVIEFYSLNKLNDAQKKVSAESVFAIVQIKSGKVTPNDVKALYADVKKYGATAGVMVSFADQKKTVENQRSIETFDDCTGPYPVIQSFTIEDFFAGKKINLPNIKKPTGDLTRGGSAPNQSKGDTLL